MFGTGFVYSFVIEAKLTSFAVGFFFEWRLIVLNLYASHFPILTKFISVHVILLWEVKLNNAKAH